MDDYFAQARRAFQENLSLIDVAGDPIAYNLYAGMVSFVSGVEVELKEIKRRIAALEDQAGHPGQK
jgi:hypothetical protein